MTTEYSIQKMVSDGTLSTIALGIQYLQRNDIYVRIAGVETPQSGAHSGYTWSFLDNTTLKILPVVPNGVEVVVYRRTDVDAMYNIYSQNAQFDEATIDENNQQLLYIAQEYLEQGIPGAGVDTIEFLRDDGINTYYRIKRTDGSYSSEFSVPSAGSTTKTLAREALHRSYAEAGYNVVGTFQGGFTLVNANDVGIDETTGKGFTGPAGDVAAGTNPASGGFVDRSGLLPGSGTVRDGKFALRDFVSLADFIPAHADKNYLADAEFAAALQYARDNGITNILLPSTMVFKLSKTALNKHTSQYLRLYCDRPAPYNEHAGGAIWAASDRVFDIGIDDGNPDVTGFTQSIVLENIQFVRDFDSANAAADTSDVAVNVVNTAQFTMKGCRTSGFKQGGLRLEGGVVIAKHIDTESFGLTGHTATIGYGSGIVMGTKYWGTFVLQIERPHIFSYAHAFTFGRARGIRIKNPVMEGLRHSCYHFVGGEEIASLEIDGAYSELIRDYILYGESFIGLIYNLSVTNSEIHECPGFSPKLSNMDRSRVLRFHQGANLLVDATLDAQLGTNTPGRLVESSWFPTGTIMDDPAYFNDLFRMFTSLKRKELLLTAGTFSSLTGGYPVGWSAFGTSVAWSLQSSPTNNGHILQSGGGDWIHAQRSMAKAAAVKLYAIAITHTGELTLKADDAIIYQATNSGLKTAVVKFRSAANATLLLALGPISDINSRVNISEMRLWEVGAADHTEVGATSGLLDDAIKMVLSNGVI